MSLVNLMGWTGRGTGNEPGNKKIHLDRAMSWIKKHRIPGGGIVPHHKANVATQEVTGYLIPTLWNAGEKELALELATWEAGVQQPDGSFVAIDGVPYTFDTAQVIRGFLAVLDTLPQVEVNLERACDYVENHIDDAGRVVTPSYDSWKLPDGSFLSEYCNLYVLPPLLEAGRRFSRQRYISAAERALAHFKKKPDLLTFKSELGTLSHIFGYMMEALVDLGEIESAKRGLDQAGEIQGKNGAIPAYPGVKWVCSTGMAQLAIAWYKLGNREAADKALAYLEKLQNPSGGFYGSYGEGAQYLPGEEISWAVKFYLDAYLLRERAEEIPGNIPVK